MIYMKKKKASPTTPNVELLLQICAAEVPRNPTPGFWPPARLASGAVANFVAQPAVNKCPHQAHRCERTPYPAANVISLTAAGGAIRASPDRRIALFFFLPIVGVKEQGVNKSVPESHVTLQVYNDADRIDKRRQCCLTLCRLCCRTNLRRHVRGPGRELHT